MSVTAYIGLGSNLGDRRDYLDRAVQALEKQPGMAVIQVSSFVETAPVGGPPGQGLYLNGAAELRTDLGPDELLRVLQEVEQALGRVRSERFGPRTIDLDLLLFGDVVRETPLLTVPHPRMHERLFVLEPLTEIAPQAIHPIFECSVRDLLWKLQLNLAEKPQAASQGPVLPFARVEREAFYETALPKRQGEPSRKELAGLRALVTGATSGIGRAVALELAAAGASVIIHGRQSLARAQAVADLIQAAGVDTRAIQLDLSKVENCQRLVEEAWSQWGQVDVWINNAGADTLTGDAAHWTFARKLQELLAVDVTAVMLMSREVGARMKEAGGGVIINVGWDQAETGMEGDSGQLFAASKAAVMAFTKSLALTLAPEVRVNCLAPGWIRTAWGERASARWQQRVEQETPLRRWGTPEDVACAARWLASPAASFITGQVIRVNGGVVR